MLGTLGFCLNAFFFQSFYLFFFIEVHLISTVVPVSAVQQRDSVTHI